VYIDRADSVGRFTLGHIPAGSFTIFGWIDANNNRDRDEHELQDSATITLKDTARVELLAFIHDSIGPHVVTVEVRDSLTLHATFDKPVDPKQPFDSAHIMLRAADSTLIPTKAIVSAREIDKRRADSTARADSIRARRDTAFRRQYEAQHRVPADSNARVALRQAAVLATITPSKPTPVLDILIPLNQPLTPGATYRLESKDIHNLMGVPANSIRSFTVPKPPPPAPPNKSGAVPPGKPDSTRGRGAGAPPAATPADTSKPRPSPTPPATPPATSPPARTDTAKKRPPT
jgi:hypothetical protein